MNTYRNQTPFHLTNVKINKAFSRETTCYKALLCDDSGTAIASVENDGHGGTDMVFPVDVAAQERLTEAVAALPPYVFEDGTTYERKGWDCISSLCLAEYEARKHAKTYFTFLDAGQEIERGFSHLTVTRGRSKKKLKASEAAMAADFLAANPDVVVVESAC